MIAGSHEETKSVRLIRREFVENYSSLPHPTRLFANIMSI